MSARTVRLALTVLAVMLPGPWTPIILLIYLLRRDTDADNRAEQYDVPDPVWSRPREVDANPYACPRS